MDLLADLLTDETFLLPAMGLADAIAASGGSVHAYVFDWAPPASRFKSCHVIELPFVFGTYEHSDAPMLAGGAPGSDGRPLGRCKRSMDCVHAGRLTWAPYVALVAELRSHEAVRNALRHAYWDRWRSGGTGATRASHQINSDQDFSHGSRNLHQRNCETSRRSLRYRRSRPRASPHAGRSSFLWRHPACGVGPGSGPPVSSRLRSTPARCLLTHNRGSERSETR